LFFIEHREVYPEVFRDHSLVLNTAIQFFLKFIKPWQSLWFFIFTERKKMKTLIIISIFLITVLSTFAQKNFEGRITYQLTGNRGKINALADVYFKTNKIKAALRTAPDEAKSKDDLIILLDSGFIYHLNLDKGSYTRDDLNKTVVLYEPEFIKSPFQNKRIQGVNCQAVRVVTSPVKPIMGGADITLWPADSLLFPCNKKFATNELSIAFINGTNISLAALLIFNTPEGKDSATLNAVSIVPGIQEDSIFFLPKDLIFATDIINQNSREVDPESIAAKAAIDSIVRIVDSVVNLAVKKATKTTSPNRSSKNTHKQPTKPSATKPKE